MMFGKRTYCILGTMLLAFASLGAGVSAEQSNEQVSDLEDLGILELSMSEDGVIEAMVTKEAFYAFMDVEDCQVPAIESISMVLTLNAAGELMLSEFSMGVGEEQSDEVEVIIHLSDDVLELLDSEDLDLEELFAEIGIEDYDDEYVDYLGSDIYWADQAYQLRGSQDDYDRVLDSEEAEYEFYLIYEEVAQDLEEEESEEEFGPEEDSDADLVNATEDDEENWEDLPDMHRDHCERGLLRGVFTINDDGNGTMRGLVMDEGGEVIGNMWGSFNTDGFAHGLGGADNLTDVKWKAVYEDGRFTGLWKMIDENDSMNGLLKGHYETNETGDGGVFHGKWKEVDCRDMRDESERPDMDDVRPRHTPLQVDGDRIDARPLDRTPQDKPLMDKLGDVMDKPIVEDENGGAIVDIGDAAAGSTLGTIVLLGAGFLRRRVTGGL
ncbi:MAG: hypothetical protein QF684_05345 [Candidatus Thalassarchaeaceae archaeon]|nr:hypothetical protein [Candidatus Thalassarchaeaceae archaeon]